MTLSTRLLLLALFVTGIASGVILLKTIQSHTPNKTPTGSTPNTQPVWQQQLTPVVKSNSDIRQTRDDFSFISQAEQQTDLTNEIVNLTHRIHLLEQQVDSLKQQISSTDSAANRRLNKIKLPTKNFQLYTTERLIKGGIDEILAQTIVREQSEIELRRLELQDKAKRENYYLTPQYEQELAAIESHSLSLRERLGDYQYDLYLFNSRVNNRVKAASVMQGSAAEQAGIQNGDIILDYDGRRIFEWAELKDATTEGERGEYVTINILRNDELFSLTIPRGPLGVRLGAARIEP